LVSLSSLKNMPTPLLFVLVMNIIVLFLYMFSVNDPWLLESSKVVRALSLITYFVCPLAIVATVLFRNIFFLPFSIVQGVGLLLMIIDQADHGGATPMIRLFVFIGMAISGVMVFNHDTLFPFQQKGQRFWRRSTRLSANTKLDLCLPDSQDTVAVVVQDCSLTGVGIFTSCEEEAPYLDGLAHGDPIQLVYKTISKNIAITGQICWRNKAEGIRQYGVAIPDAKSMERLIKEVRFYSGDSPLSTWLIKNWMNSQFRNSLTAVWAFTLAASLMWPFIGS
jgi:hypothetical protein